MRHVLVHIGIYAVIAVIFYSVDDVASFAPNCEVAILAFVTVHGLTTVTSRGALVGVVRFLKGFANLGALFWYAIILVHFFVFSHT